MPCANRTQLSQPALHQTHVELAHIVVAPMYLFLFVNGQMKAYSSWFGVVLNKVGQVAEMPWMLMKK